MVQGPKAEARKLPTGGEAAAARRLDRFLQSRVARYHEDRDRPDRDGTSRLSPYLRFGAISVRQCVASAEQVAQRHEAGELLHFENLAGAVLANPKSIEQ